MDHVGPVLAQNVCDFPREEQIFVGFATAFSGIFIWKETKLISNGGVFTWNVLIGNHTQMVNALKN